jgi:hypothetical protein
VEKTADGGGGGDLAVVGPWRRASRRLEWGDGGGEKIPPIWVFTGHVPQNGDGYGCVAGLRYSVL